MKQKRLLVMAGGTGGHVFPGIAVAQELMNRGWQIHWLGTKDRMEADLVPNYGIDIDFIEISGLRGKGFKTLLLAPINIVKAIYQSKKIIKRYQPDVVLGMGGYVSGPGGVAAWLSGIPLVLHEQNGIAGLTNRWLAKIATRVLQAFPTAFKQAEVVGNPIRQKLKTLPEPKERLQERKGPLRILVIGGSQGARILNQTVPQIAKELGDKVTIWHQTGKGMLTEVEAAYHQLSTVQHKVTEFIDDMSQAYSWADLVICRSGALTVSEIAAVGLPAIFIPFMHKDRQQYWNAYPLEQEGAAIIIEQTNLTAAKLAQTIMTFDHNKLMDMAIKSRKTAILNATERVADVVVSVSE